MNRQFVLAYALLAAFVVLVAFCVRSYAYRDQLNRGLNWFAMSSEGVIYLRFLDEQRKPRYSTFDNRLRWEPYVIEGTARPVATFWGFGYQTRPGWRYHYGNVMQTTLAFPHWLLIVSVGILALWARPRPKFRFSLGEFALITTVFTLLLGFAS